MLGRKRSFGLPHSDVELRDEALGDEYREAFLSGGTRAARLALGDHCA
jgi:hypothetical protein